MEITLKIKNILNNMVMNVDYRVRITSEKDVEHCEKTAVGNTATAWKELYLQAREKIEILTAENERLKAERDNANRNVERLSALSWNRPVGF